LCLGGEHVRWDKPIIQQWRADLMFILRDPRRQDKGREVTGAQLINIPVSPEMQGRLPVSRK
jgi:hypothetical protein